MAFGGGMRFLLVAAIAALAASPAAAKHGADDGAAAGPVAAIPSAPVTNSSLCASVLFKGKAQTYANCANLDAAGTFRMAWTYDQTSKDLHLWFEGLPETPYGWAAWGISPDGKMFGSQIMVGFANPDNPAQARVETLYVKGLAARFLVPSVALGAVKGSEAIEMVDAGKTYRMKVTLANYMSPTGAVSVIWKGGPGVSDYGAGTLIPHTSLAPNAVAIDFTKSGSGVTPAAPLPATNPAAQGPAAAPAGGSSSSPAAVGGTRCGTSVEFLGFPQAYDHCILLDDAGSFKLAWTYDPRSRNLSVWFEGTPEAAYGWAGWGISPDGKMVGSDVILGYGAAATQGSSVAQYHLGGVSPDLITPQNNLKAAANGLAVEVLNGGKTIRTIARFLNYANTTGNVHVIWKGGPGVEAGSIVPHSDLSGATRQLDFSSGDISGLDTSTYNLNAKVAHAWLVGVGYGVLVPLGILVARHLKLWADPAWYWTHIVIQVCGYILGVTGWSYGIWLKGQFGDLSLAPSYQQAHYGIGIAIFCSSTLQILSPLAKPDKQKAQRLYWNLAHWVLGYSTAILAIVNIFLGFSIMGNESINYGSWRTVYIVLISMWGGLMLILEPISWYKHAQNNRLLAEQEDAPGADFDGLEKGQKEEKEYLEPESSVDNVLEEDVTHEKGI